MREFGDYGGRYVPETLIPALDELERAWEEAQADDAFHAELRALATTYVGRPSPLTLIERFAPGKKIYLKREDLMHTGSHKLNNALGQAGKELSQRFDFQGTHARVEKTPEGLIVSASTEDRVR